MSSTLQFQVNPKIEGIWTHLCYDQPPVIDASDNVDNDADERATNKEGYVAYTLVEPRKVWVLIRAKTHGFQEITLGPVQMPHDELITVDLTPEVKILSRLTAHREGFQNMDNQVVRLSGVSAFMHYERFLNGEDIRPLLQQVQQLGSNTIRVFGMAHYIPVNAGRRPFRPADYGDTYFSSQAEFLASRRSMVNMFIGASFLTLN